MQADVQQEKQYPSLAYFGQCACLVPCCSCHGSSGLSGKATYPYMRLIDDLYYNCNGHSKTSSSYDGQRNAKSPVTWKAGREVTFCKAVQPGIFHFIKLILNVVPISIEVALLSFFLQVKWLKCYACFIEGLLTAAQSYHAKMPLHTESANCMHRCILSHKGHAG